MVRLEKIDRQSVVRGILPEGLVTISDVRWIGTVAIEVTYKDSAGRLGNELLYRDRESTLDLVEGGRPWSFDGDGALFRLLSEAYRIRLPARVKSTSACSKSWKRNGRPWGGKYSTSWAS